MVVRVVRRVIGMMVVVSERREVKSEGDSKEEGGEVKRVMVVEGEREEGEENGSGGESHRQ